MDLHVHLDLVSKLLVLSLQDGSEEEIRGWLLELWDLHLDLLGVKLGGPKGW